MVEKALVGSTGQRVVSLFVCAAPEVLLSDSRQCMKLKASERRRTLALWRGILQGGGYVLTDGCCRRGALANGRLDGRDLRGTVTARPFVSASKTNAICRSDKWAAT
jgi:hypothetical protein